MNHNPYQIYKQNQVKVVSQGKLILMLYQGAIRFLGLASAELERKNYEKTTNFLIRAQDIIEELDITLDLNAGPVAHQLHTFYQSVLSYIVTASLKFDRDLIYKIIGLLEDMEKTWEVLVNGTDGISSNEEIV